MSGFHNQRPFVGSIAKKPRLGPRGPHLVAGNLPGDDDGKRLISFKEFILSQNNDIHEQEALKLYTEYKTEFIRRQVDKFFKEHQEEEWFRNKYRPTELKKAEEVLKVSKAKRKDLYEKLVEKKLVEDFLVDYQHSDKLTQFLNYFSLLLEGATFEEIESGEAIQKYAVSSIFIPNLDPSVDKSMLEEYAKKDERFLRVATSDAQLDKGFRRRAWITYKQMTHDELTKLCWEYNAHKFSGQEVKAFINKEMNNRIRYTQFWFNHSQAAKADLKNIAKILTHFEGEDCPMLESIKDHLIEESNEEAKMLGVEEQNDSGFEFTQDNNVMKDLDRLILYLRMVHSFDYYASTEYSGEDSMPQKVGTMFARPRLPTTYGDCPQDILREFIEAQKNRVDSFLDKPILNELELKQLGSKNVEEEVENFIYQHTVEKEAGKRYLCKLTKKKFTAPEFVRKHIINRCSDKLDEVRTEVEYFNNYVADPKRPM